MSTEKWMGADDLFWSKVDRDAVLIELTCDTFHSAATGSEPKKCKHCGKAIVQDTAGRGWRHGSTGPSLCCETRAEPGTPPSNRPTVTLDRETWVQELAKRAQRCLGCQKVWITPEQLRDLCAAYQPNGLESLLIDVAQLLDGWHQDGTAWSEWDESVRQRVGVVLALLRAAGEQP